MIIVNECRVELLDSLGGDLTVANSARVSMNKVSSLNEDGSLKPADVRLIGYLAREEHWTPFGHVIFQLRIACPVFVARQWMRSNVGVVRNEVSRRYVDSPPEFFLPKTIHSRPDGSIKQGAGGEHQYSDEWLERIENFYKVADFLYKEMIEDNVAPEEARMILPLGHMTEFYETGSLAYYARILKLRLDHHTQGATTSLANAVYLAIKDKASVALHALLSNENA